MFLKLTAKREMKAGGEKKQLNAYAVFGHYLEWLAEAKSLQEKWLICRLPKLHQRSAEKVSGVCQLCLSVGSLADCSSWAPSSSSLFPF